ncbi:ead/Ea22-like family protein [Enterobacter hormaechei]|uniref:ead/Ea22-like family protein n=1 Tax=Enterobacter hormaechei TaxID=158836 RepID=UPI0034CD93FE
MSNIDKQALRQHAEHIIELEGDEAICHRALIDAYEKSDQLFTAQNVLALLDELEAAEKLVNQQGNIAVALFDEVTTLRRNADDKAPELRSQLEEAENRIAELEARVVKLPKPISVLHRRDFMDSHRSIYAYPEAEVNAALADAGINVAAAGKGE